MVDEELVNNPNLNYHLRNVLMKNLLVILILMTMWKVLLTKNLSVLNNPNSNDSVKNVVDEILLGNPKVVRCGLPEPFGEGVRG